MDEITTVRGDLELVARAGHLFTSVTEEFACAARDLDTWSQPSARAALTARMFGTGKAFTTRKLLSPAALADESSRDHLREVAAHGALVRIASAPLPHETILIDRRIMILAGTRSPGDREYTVTSSAPLVNGVYALFQAAWEAATDLQSFLRGDHPHLDSDARTILASLASGSTDEAAARRLGLSLRTYRRRVAALLTALDADSRFQAGLRAGELGITT